MPIIEKPFGQEAWRIVDPVHDGATEVYPYERGTWGPAHTDRFVMPPGGWHNPTMARQETSAEAVVGAR